MLPRGTKHAAVNKTTWTLAAKFPCKLLTPEALQAPFNESGPMAGWDRFRVASPESHRCSEVCA